MVDPLGSKPIAPGDRVALTPVARAAPAPSVQSGTERATVGLQASSLAMAVREMASRPPVDTERVARIREAVRDGTFPILPATVADHMLALKLNWNPNDKA